MTEINWKVGDRVQREAKGLSKVGVVFALIESEREVYLYRSSFSYSSKPAPPKMEKYISELTVKWDDGTEETDGTYYFHPEDSEFEREFRNAIPDANKRIQEKLDLASKYLEEALKISEETGVPFESGISFLGQSYVPKTFEGKFPEVSNAFMQEAANVYNDYPGWQHSAIC